MQVSKSVIGLACVSLAILSSCKREIEQQVIYDNIIYEIDTVPVYQSNAEKDRLKSPLQYISGLYSNLYLSSIPSNVLDNLVIYRSSVGDKTLVNEMILNAMLQSPDVLETLPEDDEMRDDVEAFVEESYLRFYLRKPSAYESYAMTEMIDSDPDMTVVDVYRAFLLSNEYMFY